MEVLRTNPDKQEINNDIFVLRSENVPVRLRPLLTKYNFRKCTINEIFDSEYLTKNAWPGLPETTKLDLRARELINNPVCGAFDNSGKMVGYTRLLWGYDNGGKPEIFSHMTAVRNDIRDGGIGEALKWLARQIALGFPDPPVTQLSVTFDNLQSRNCHINFNKLGMVCGYAGGKFKEDVYGTLAGKQHKGNPTDRYKAYWYLNSPWTRAHLEEKVVNFSLEQTRKMPTTISSLQKLNLDLNAPYITMPIPFDWDKLLENNQGKDYDLANTWRSATQTVIQEYFEKQYTTIAQATDKERGISLQIMALNFDPFNPPQELLKL